MKETAVSEVERSETLSVVITTEQEAQCDHH